MKAGTQRHAPPKKMEALALPPPSTYHKGAMRKEAEQLIRKLPREQQRLLQLLLILTGDK